MAKVKVINTNLDSNLNGTNFNGNPAGTIFSFGSFNVTSNFEGRKYIDYSNTLSTFVRPVTLETMGVTEVQSQVLHTYSTNAVLNLDDSDLNTFVRFGSAYEFLRVSVQNIILAYPGSLFANSQLLRAGNDTYTGLTYDSGTTVATFRIPTIGLVNTFGLVYNEGNLNKPDNIELKNLNISYDKYVIWNQDVPDAMFPIIGFTGYTANTNNSYLVVRTIGNPFAIYTGNTGNSGSVNFHMRPNTLVFEEFRSLLSEYERYIVAERVTGVTYGFQFTLKDPTLLDDGSIIYTNTPIFWATTDKYNVDTNTSSYQTFLEIILRIGAKYDVIKTDLIARFLTPTSLKTYDFTEQGKMTKLLKIYGREFDQIRQFIDSLVYINKVTYDKINNIPDQLVKNLANTFGWDYFSLVNESELVNNFLTVDALERNLNQDLLPAEIDIELWKRILINANYFWKSKGTREAIKSMFLLIGIPEPFINITEYVYTVEGKIDPNTVYANLAQADFPSNSYPFDSNGYPVAPLETSDFYFQVSGDTDGGQTYLNAFRKAGFNLKQTVDNKKSWIQTGATTRIDDTTPQYYQVDSKLVINTKEVDVALDTARGIEYDVYRYIKDVDFPANNSGYTLPFSYVNISLGYTGSENVFTLPSAYNKAQGNLEVRFNGILLNAPKEYSGGTGGTYSETTRADYTITGNTFSLTNGNYAKKLGNQRDVIQATYIYSGGTHPITGITVQYIVTRIKANAVGTVIPLPSYPRGDVQVTINGIALTKGTNQFNADYIVDPNNTTGSSQIIIQNADVISYLASNPDIQVSYVEVVGSNDINARSEVVRVDSFNSSKIYFNQAANKYVYKLNYKANSATELKVLVDGIGLEPLIDYNINVMNPYELFLPKGIRYGTVISVYYLVGGNAAFKPVVSDAFGIGDISKLSFLEFIELIQRKMINAKNRKTITDFKGGWYPTLLRIYEMYLKRGYLPTTDTLHSNGYTFENLYPFLSKYNAFFQRFVDQLLSATIIVKKGGLLVRNTVFTKQKYVYKRGVNLMNLSNALDMRGDKLLPYLGDDGSMFQIYQFEIDVPPLPPDDLAFETMPLVITTYNPTTYQINSGAINISGQIGTNTYSGILEYGIGSPGVIGSVTYPLTPITMGTTTAMLEYTVPFEYNKLYYYRAKINAATGNTLTSMVFNTDTAIDAFTTRAGTVTQTSIVNTGTDDINDLLTNYENDYSFYGMIYRKLGDTAWIPYPANYITNRLTATNFSITIPNLLAETTYEYRAFVQRGDFLVRFGSLRQATTLALASLLTKSVQAVDATSILSGGYNINNWQNVTAHGMQYRSIGVTTGFDVAPTSFTSLPSLGIVEEVMVTGEPTNTYTVSVGANTWLIPADPEPPIPSGFAHTVAVQRNNGIARTGCVCFTPTVGSVKCVSFSQLAAGGGSGNAVSILCASGGYGTNDESGDILAVGELSASMSGGQNYYANLTWGVHKESGLGQIVSVDVCCNGTQIFYCQYTGNISKTCTGTLLPIHVFAGDSVIFKACACTNMIPMYANTAGFGLASVTNGTSGTFIKGTQTGISARTIKK